MTLRPGTNEVFLAYSNGIERLDVDELLSPVRQPRAQPVALRTVPNPTSGAVTVTVPESAGRTGNIRLFDLSGRSIQVNHTQTSNQLVLDLGSLSSGIYVVRCNEATLARREVVRQQAGCDQTPAAFPCSPTSTLHLRPRPLSLPLTRSHQRLNPGNAADGFRLPGKLYPHRLQPLVDGTES